MNIQKNQIDALNVELTLNITADDYAPLVKKKLAERRRTAEFKGFRKGNVPASLIERVYGEQALGDAVNDKIYEGLNSFVEENKLKLIGEPIPSEDQPEVEWKSGNDFTFKFDLGIAPEINLEVSDKDEVVRYTIKRTAEAEAEMKKTLLMQNGDLEEVETPAPESYVYVDLENAQKTVENAYISMRDVSEAMKPAMMGIKAGDKLEINVNELLEREGDRATLLKVKKEDLASIDPVFNATVVNVKTFMPAPLCQETYDKIFGESKVTSEEEFDKAVGERLAENYRQEADYRLDKDIKDYLLKKADIALPEAFLKRWLYSINKEKFTMEDIEKEFDAFLADYRWQLVCDKLMEKFDLKVTDDDLKEAALGYVQYQYAMYGMSNIPAEFIQEAANKMLADEKQAQNLAENVAGQKVISTVKEKISLGKKTISVEKFRELK